MISKIKCTQCGAEIGIDEAIYKQLQGEAESQVRKNAQAEVEQKFDLKIKDLESQLGEKDKKLKLTQEEELKLRKEKRQLEEDKQNFDLTLQRKVDEVSKKMIGEVLSKAEEEHKFKAAEKDKVINNLRKDLEEAHRRSQVGSQQLQGEVLEEDIERMLREMFPQDLIEEIAKGVNGSDVKQSVRSPRGGDCGVILWECKRTKAWSQAWIGKLKQDFRDSKADIPVLVSTTLPATIKGGSGIIEGVYVCDFSHAEFLAHVLRRHVLAVAYQKVVSANKGEKSEMLYALVTGKGFIQKMEVLLEVYNTIKLQTDKERKVYTKIWSERDAQLEKLLNSTIDIYGNMAGILGSSMPQIKDLDILALESGDNKDSKAKKVGEE